MDATGKAPKFETILDLGDGMRWVVIDDKEQADRAERLSMTAVGMFYGMDLKSGNLSDLRCYYALTEAEGDPRTMPVVLVADKRGGEDTKHATLVTGYRNANPYPKHGERIAALSRTIGIPLPPKSYPYGRNVEPAEDDEPSSPTP